jgi:hypothetical protein
VNPKTRQKILIVLAAALACYAALWLFQYFAPPIGLGPTD